jgi:hypothetical protein
VCVRGCVRLRALHVCALVCVGARARVCEVSLVCVCVCSFCVYVREESEIVREKREKKP